MSESKPLVKLPRSVLMSEFSEDMAAAAQQLIQLSDEENSSIGSNSNGHEKRIKAKGCKRLFEEQSSHLHQDEITSAMIEEIFGKEVEILRPINNYKKRRYRFLESIYQETKPIKVSYGKNQWY